MDRFVLSAPFQAQGDQPKAIDALSEGIQNGLKNQILLGVTGSGKTFTMASVIERVQKPALVLAHNKTLAAQLCAEFRSFFPENAVEYFVSYYDYYQPEAYIASTDTYIAKDSAINIEIDRLRHSATAALRERRDVIVVASVSCIYSLGDPSEYEELMVSLRLGTEITLDELILRLTEIQYQRNDFDLERGKFRVRGDTVEIIPASFDNKGVRIEFFGDEIERISEFDVITGKTLSNLRHALIYPASHYVTSQSRIDSAIQQIEDDLKSRADELEERGLLLEAQRLIQRTQYDIEMLREIGYCSGIENYSRYFDGRAPGDAPFTLLDYFGGDWILFVDESHVTIPQIRAMYNGDHARKTMLVDYGFRLPSAFDNRPLRFEEFEQRMPQTIYVSATPGIYESERTENIVEQIIRPTGLLDPEVIVRPATNQVDDLAGEIQRVIKEGNRILVTTLTKNMAENLCNYLQELEFKVRYLHSDIKTLERTEILRDLRLGVFDVLVGINLLREGLDLPEVALIAILDADKEGFLRSETSLIQTIGRAARNENGRVIMYADVLTESMQNAINETNRRRILQMAYNEAHHIKPMTIRKQINDLITATLPSLPENNLGTKDAENREEMLNSLKNSMFEAAQNLDFERAAQLRDQLFALQEIDKQDKKGKRPKNNR